MSAAAFLAVLIGLRIHKPRVRAPWIVLAAAQASFLSRTSSGTPTTTSIPTARHTRRSPTAFTCSAIRCFALGLIMFIRARQPRYRMTAAIDAILIGLAAVLVLWLLVIDGVIHDETIPALERLITIAYPIGDALVLAAAAYLLLTGRHGPPFAVPACRVAGCHARWGHCRDRPGVSSAYPAPSDAFWLVSYALFGLAALDPAMAEIGEPSERPIIAESTGRLVLIGLAITMLPAFALYQRFFSDHIDLPLIGITGIVVIGAILLRMHELGAVLGRSERRYASLLANASDAFAVVDPDGQLPLRESSASERVLGYPLKETMTHTALDFINPRARSKAEAVLRRVATQAGRPGRGRSPGAARRRRVALAQRDRDKSDGRPDRRWRRAQLPRHHGAQGARGAPAPQAFTDGLTGLANRPLFIDRLDHVLAVAGTIGDEAFAVLFLDVDDFKTVNDSLGHSAGDQLLVTLGERLRATLRPADTAARLGGDEFAVLLEGARESEARRVADRLLRSIAMPVPVGEHFVQRDRIDWYSLVDSALRTSRRTTFCATRTWPCTRPRRVRRGPLRSTTPAMHEEAMRRLEEHSDLETPQSVERRPTARWESSSTAKLKTTPAAT